MPSKIDFDGLFTKYHNEVLITNIPIQNIGYCKENPIEVVKRLARKHSIWKYEDYRAPFGDNKYGLVITSSDAPKGCTITGTLDDLAKDVNKKFDLPTGYSGNESYTAKRKTPLTERKLKKAFLKKVLNYFLITWKDFDAQLLKRIINDELDDKIGRSQRKLEKLDDFRKFEYLLRKGKESMETLIPRIREALPQFTDEMEREVYRKTHECYGLVRPLELLAIFGIEDANYHDLKKMLKKERSKR